MKKILGWILVIIQCIAIIGRLASGASFPSGIPGFFNLLGFLSFGIIGVILLIVAYKNEG